MRHTCIHAGWLIDGTGSAARKDVRICGDGHFITAVEPMEKPYTGPSADILDLSTHTLMPRLVDCHVHLFMSGTEDMAVRKHQLEAEYDELAPVIARHIDRHISCGIGAVRDGGDGKGLAMRYVRSGVRQRPEDGAIRDADRTGLQIKVAGRAWHQSGRYGKLIGRAPAPGRTLAEAIAEEAGGPAVLCPDHVKIVQSGVNSLICFGKETLPQFSQEAFTAAVCEAVSWKLPVMVHANGRLPVQIAVEAGCHSIEHGFFMGADNLARMRDRQTVWVPTAFTMRAYARHLPASGREADTARRNLDHQMDQIRMAREMGVPVALGTDAGSIGVHHGISVREELAIFMESGYGIEGAVRCATRNGAELLQIAGMGILAPGMPADSFLALEGGPASVPDRLAAMASSHL